MAVGTITFAQSSDGPIRTITATCTASSTDGSFPATALPAFEGRLQTVRQNPGSPAPTDNYDYTIVDGDGIDRIQGVGANRDTANSEEELIVYTSTGEHPVVDINETLTLTITNNSVNSAVIVITLTYSTT